MTDKKPADGQPPVTHQKYTPAFKAECVRQVAAGARPSDVARAHQMPTKLVLTALKQGLTLRQPAPGLVIHADQGSQYTSHACRQRLEGTGAVASYARPGNPYDNAQAKAGWSKLKTELLPHGGAFTSLEEARLEVAYYLNTYFNLDHRHSALGYRSSHQVEANLF